MANVFLSHSSKDKELASRIANDLRLQGVNVWLDEWEIRVGDSITQKISRGLDQMALVAVLLTANSVNSGWVEKEWQSKIGEEATERKVLILPIKADSCQIPRLLRDKKYANIQDNYDAGFSDLLVAIRANSPKTTVTFLMIGFNVEFPTTWMSTLTAPVTWTVEGLIGGYEGLCRLCNTNARVVVKDFEDVNSIGDPNHPMLGQLVALDWLTLSPLPYDLPLSDVKPPYIVLFLRDAVCSSSPIELKHFFMREPNIAEALSIWLSSNNSQGKCPIRFFYRSNGYVRPEKVENAS